MIRISIVLLLVFISFQLFATHNRAGEITYEQVGDLTIVASITTYTKATSVSADRDSLEICWGDGDCESVVRFNGPIDANGIPQGELLPNNSKKNLYTIVHTYAELGVYKMSMTDPNRNAGISNINPFFSDNVPFHIQTEFTLLESYNSSPVLLESPIDIGYVGQTFYHTPNAYDADGDSLAYRIVTPLQGLDDPVPNYLPLTDFSTGSNTVFLDEATGLLQWDAPQLSSEYVVAIEILSYRDGVQIGSMIRDMQILIFSGLENEISDLALTQFMPNELTTVEVGDTIQFLVIAEDTENTNELMLTATSGLFDPSFSSNPVFTIFFQNETSTEANFFWEVSADQAREQPYQVAFKVMDDFGLANFVVLRFKIDELTNVPEVVVEEPINLYPNPCGDYLFLDSNAFVGQQYEVCNLVGNKVHVGRISGNEVINLVGIRNGVYIVKFENGRFGKFIKN